VFVARLWRSVKYEEALGGVLGSLGFDGRNGAGPVCPAALHRFTLRLRGFELPVGSRRAIFLLRIDWLSSLIGALLR